MRTLLGLLIALALLAGCGEEVSRDAADNARTTSVATVEPTTADPTTVDLVSASDVGGEVEATATPVPDATALEEYAGRFEDARMGEALADAGARAELPAGTTLMAAVVAIGCTPPTAVSIEVDGDDVLVTAAQVKDGAQCLVPVTTVALVAVPT